MATYYVGSGGSDSNSGTSWANRKLTLNGAEDIPVAAGDTVYVAPGTYRETLTVDVSGSSGNPITYIGDYSGANTDGIGGVVRVTGSDNDQTPTRNNAISASGRNYRTFRGFSFDMGNTNQVLFQVGGTSTNWIIEDCVFAHSASSRLLNFEGGGSAHTVRRCLFAYSGSVGLYLTHSSTVNDTGTVIENCIFLATRQAGIRIGRIGGVTIRNCTTINCGSGIHVETALSSGQTVTVNNCILTANTTALQSVSSGWLVEDYNSLFANSTDRTNVSVGSNSNAYPPLFDVRWFFEAAGLG